MPFPVSNIREAAKQRNLTLAQIEKALSIGNGVIAKWEKNKGTPPYDRIVAIAELLDVPVSRLTGEDTENKKPAHESGPNKDMLLDLIANADAAELQKALKAISKRLGEL